MPSIDQYLSQYGPMLAGQAEERLDPLHVPARDGADPALEQLLRPPFEAQAHVITGTAKALARQKAVLVVGEMGTGKTLIGLAACHLHAAGRPYRALVFCPGHLVRKWAREIEETIPEATVTILENCRDVAAIDRSLPDGPAYWIISRDRAKLGPKWRPVQSVKLPSKEVEVYAVRCPRCGRLQADKNDIPIEPSHFARVRRFCNRLDDDGTKCGEALWQNTRAIDRFEPAKYIHKRMKHFFDYLILDEVHEEKSANSAQANAAGSLIAAAKRVIALTGTLVGGYAEHLRPLLFRLCPKSLIDEGFKWHEVTRFNEVYGRIETRISESESSGASNSMSRGRSKSTTKVVRPGIVPTVFGRHLMGNTVFLMLDEVADNLPTLEESVIGVEMDTDIAACYQHMEQRFAEEIRELIRAKGPGGCRKVIGPMLQTLLAYPDYPFGWSQVGYYLDEAWRPVVEPVNLDRGKLRAKERKLLELVDREYNRCRQVWVFAIFTHKHPVVDRLADLIRAELGIKVGVLRETVEPAKREAWIAENGPKYDCIISNPKLVETGVDLFDKGGRHNFPTIIFYETGYSTFTLRQASRRAWRIGQEKACKVIYLYYEATMQERALALMGRKMTAAQSIDGRFSAEGLAAMAEDDSMELQMAKSLADSIPESAGREWEKLSGPSILSFEEFQYSQEAEELVNILAELTT